MDVFDLLRITLGAMSFWICLGGVPRYVLTTATDFGLHERLLRVRWSRITGARTFGNGEVGKAKMARPPKESVDYGKILGDGRMAVTATGV